MPELPEVEVVRAGLAGYLTGRELGEVQVRHPRAVRHHVAGPGDFVARLEGATVLGASRRGKYLWLPLGTGDALVAHLGMSGQFLVGRVGDPVPEHTRVSFTLGGFRDGPPAADGMTVPSAGMTALRFVDQRTFGGLSVEVGGADLPARIAHIARDALDPLFDDDTFVDRLRRRRTGVKRALLDQTLISGVGNIYADEALWRARLHFARATDRMTRPVARTLLAAVRAVLTESLASGGTSFDRLYVSVNGQSGYFGRSLAVYGREHQPCPRCGTPIRRVAFMNRSSHFCPRCQPVPRHGRW